MYLFISHGTPFGRKSLPWRQKKIISKLSSFNSFFFTLIPRSVLNSNFDKRRREQGFKVFSFVIRVLGFLFQKFFTLNFSRLLQFSIVYPLLLEDYIQRLQCILKCCKLSLCELNSRTGTYVSTCYIHFSSNEYYIDQSAIDFCKGILSLESPRSSPIQRLTKPKQSYWCPREVKG